MRSVKGGASRGLLACSAVLAAFLGLGFVAVLHHEPWRDEIEIWLIARDSASLGELLHNMRTEGHPVLWYLLNFGLTRFTRDPLAMQLTNLAIGAAAALLFFRAAPFGLATRLLFAFGYYALFEFTLIARSYALGLLLLFAFCARASRREPRIDFVGAVLLVLLAHTNLFGTIIAVALVLLDAFEAFLAQRRGRPAQLVKQLPALALASLGAIVAFAHVWAQADAISPAHGGRYPSSYDLGWLLEGLATLALGALPLPLPASQHPWNSSLAQGLAAPWYPLVPVGVGVGLVIAGVLALRHRPRSLAAFGLGVVPMLALTLFVYFGSLRHHAQPFLWFVACAWLAGGLRREPGSASGPPRAAEPLLVGLLAVQAIAGAMLLAADATRPFSSARATAAWLERPEYADALLVGSVDYAVQPIAAWTESPFYYPEQRRFGTFVDWGGSRVQLPTNRALEEGIDLVRRESRSVVLVLTTPPPSLLRETQVELRPDVHARYLASFEGAIVPDENYTLFLLYDPRGP